MAVTQNHQCSGTQHTDSWAQAGQLDSKRKLDHNLSISSSLWFPKTIASGVNQATAQHRKPELPHPTLANERDATRQECKDESYSQSQTQVWKNQAACQSAGPFCAAGSKQRTSHPCKPKGQRKGQSARLLYRKHTVVK